MQTTSHIHDISYDLDYEASLINSSLEDLWSEWSELMSEDASATLHQATTPGQRSLAFSQPEIVYTCFPYLFYPDFAAVPLYNLRLLARASYLHAMQGVLCNGLLEEPLGTPLSCLKASIFQSEALQVLYRLFSTSSPFWLQLKDYQHAYVHALSAEQFWRTQPITKFSQSHAEQIARGKARPAALAITGLALLNGTPERQHALGRSLEMAQIGLHFYDELREWKRHLLRQQPSLLLAELCRRAGLADLPASLEERAASLPHFKELLNRSGLAQQAAARAADYFLEAREALTTIPAPAPTPQHLPTWRRFLDEGYTAMIELEQDLRRPGAERGFWAVRLAKDEGSDIARVDDLLSRALVYLCAQQRRGGEWGDFLLIGSGHNINQLTGYIGTALLPFAAARSQLERTTHWLLRATSEGGWGQNWRSPRDANSTATCGLFLLTQLARLGPHNRELRLCLEQVIKTLQAYQHADGGFSMYLASDAAHGRHLLDQDWQHWLHPHLEITATCGRFFLAQDAAMNAPALAALESVLSNQAEEGCWHAYWYDGPLYGTTQALKLLKMAVKVGWRDPRIESAVGRALALILQTQRHDGGWSLPADDQTEPSASATALALQSLITGLDTLLALQQPVKDEQDSFSKRIAHQVEHGLYWLKEQQASDGSWPASHILRIPDPARAKPWLDEFQPASSTLFDRVVCDQQRLFTVATVVQMLNALRAQDRLCALLRATLPSVRATA